MAIPDFQTFMLPLLKLANDGHDHTVSEAVELLGKQFQLSEEDRGQLLRSGQTRLYNRIAWATTYLKKAGLLHAVARGQFQITDSGREFLVKCPAPIRCCFLGSSVSTIRRVPKNPLSGDCRGGTTRDL